MEIRNDLPGWLHRSTCPAFSVKENIITACNQSAEALLLNPGMDVRELLETGLEEYAAFSGGCLYLKLKLSSKGCGAAVTREGEYDLFLLDQEPEDADLRSLALAARELRNPLSNLMIAADALKNGMDENSILQEQLARLNRSLHQMHRLINNMSDAGRSDLLTPAGIHDWKRLIYDIFEKVSAQLEETNVTVTFEGLDQSVLGLANVGQLERAILNIVSNAVKFMPEGGSSAFRIPAAALRITFWAMYSADISVSPVLKTAGMASDWAWFSYVLRPRITAARCSLSVRKAPEPGSP